QFILFQGQVRPVIEVIENTLGALRPKSASIIAKRMGLRQGQPRKTLEAIGREFQITRERVRQIVENGLQTLSRNIKTLFPNLYPDIRHFVRAHGVISLDD